MTAQPKVQTHWQRSGSCSCLPNPYFALPCLQHCASASPATTSPHLGRPSSRARARARPARSFGCNPCRHCRHRHCCCCNSRHHCTRLVLLRQYGRQSCSRHCGRRRLCRPTGRRRRGSGSRRCAPCRPYIRPPSPCSPCRRPPRLRRRRSGRAFKQASSTALHEAAPGSRSTAEDDYMYAAWIDAAWPARRSPLRPQRRRRRWRRCREVCAILADS